MVKVQYLGHSFFKVSFSGCNLLIDPFINCPPKNNFNERLLPCPVSEEKLKDIDLILITHEHFDHFDTKTIEAVAERENALVVGHDQVLRELKVKERLKRPVDPRSSLNLDGINIKPVPMHHPNSFYPLGYLLESQGTKIFHAGDTDLVNVFSRLEADILMVPIGGTITMDVVDAVRAVKTMEPSVAIPMHYNTFEIIKASPQEFREKIEKSILKTKVHVLKPKQTLKY